MVCRWSVGRGSVSGWRQRKVPDATAHEAHHTSDTLKDFYVHVVDTSCLEYVVGMCWIWFQHDPPSHPKLERVRTQHQASNLSKLQPWRSIQHLEDPRIGSCRDPFRFQGSKLQASKLQGSRILTFLGESLLVFRLANMGNLYLGQIRVQQFVLRAIQINDFLMILGVLGTFLYFFYFNQIL